MKKSMPVRRARAVILSRLQSRWGLSGSFLLVAIFAVALAMLGLGTWITQELRASIVRGFTTTAADTVGSLVAHQLSSFLPDRPLDKDAAQLVASVLEIGSDTDGARLLAVSLFDPAGQLAYQSSGGLRIDRSKTALTSALGGKIVSEFVNLPIESIGDLPTRPIVVLRVYTPLYRPGTQEELGAAELYYSAESLIGIEDSARQHVWWLVGTIGAALILVLFIFVDRASATIDRQRKVLASNLEASRRLAEENRRLHAASERLRVSASLANEDLLARVGTDLHDGPVQLLTLLILNLTKPLQKSTPSKATSFGGRASAIALARSTIEELRNISSGLVLPELKSKDLRSIIQSAVTRHEALTATTVKLQLKLEGAEVSEDVKVCAYRVVQEALANAYRHAGGQGQVVNVEMESRTLRIVVTNTISQVKHAPARGTGTGLGLRGMRLRVESLGGVLEFSIDHSATTATVKASIPCQSIDYSEPPVAPSPLF